MTVAALGKGISEVGEDAGIQLARTKQGLYPGKFLDCDLELFLGVGSGIGIGIHCALRLLRRAHLPKRSTKR
jgi:hypothetical protein